MVVFYATLRALNNESNAFMLAWGQK